MPADDAYSTNTPLHKLLEDWRIKERKLHSFETKLTGTPRSKYDILERIIDQGQKPMPGPSFDPQDTDEVHCLVDPIFQSGEPALKEINGPQIDSMTLGETLTSSSSFPQQCPSDLPPSTCDISCARSTISEPVARSTESSVQLQEQETMIRSLTSNYTSHDSDRTEDKGTESHQEDDDLPYCPLDYEDALGMLRKKRMAMLEEHRAAEAERLVRKNLQRQRETEESRKKLLLASQRRQELEVSSQNCKNLHSSLRFVLPSFSFFQNDHSRNKCSHRSCTAVVD